MNDTTATYTGRRRKSKAGRNLIIAALVLAAGGGGWYYWHLKQLKAAKDNEYIMGTVSRGDVEDLVTATGTLQPRDYVDVGAQVSGQIKKILVEVGDVVVKGQSLVEIDAETSQAQMDQSKANLESARNTLLTQKANLEKAERDVVRQRNLYEQDATTKQSLVDAETNYENAKRQVRGAELTIAQQEASMRINEKNLAYTTITAPIDGTVMSIAVKLGQTVNASQNVPNVLRIANLTTMTVQSDVSEADVAKLYEGIEVYFTTLGGNNRRWYGKLKRIEPTPKTQNSVVLYNALFDVQNDGTSLRPSMTAQVFFVSAQAQNVLLVPMAALQQGQQIARELAQKEREKNGGKNAAGAPGAPGAGPGGRGPGGPGGPGGFGGPGGPGAGGPPAAADTAGNATSTSATAAAPTAPATAAPVAANEPASAAGGNSRPRNRQAGNGQNGQGQRAGQPGADGTGRNFNGPRPGGDAAAGGPPGAGGAGGRGAGGFPDFQNMTPEQREQMLARRQAGGGQGGPGGAGGRGAGGFPDFQNMTPEQREQMLARRQGGGGQGGPGGGNFQGGNFRGGQGGGNFNRGNFQGGNVNAQRQGGSPNTASTRLAATPARPPSRRNGIVMVKKADGTLEQRRVVVGVSDRVRGEVIDGLKEGEEVVVGKHETEAAAAPRTNNNNNNDPRRGGAGGFNGGGGGFPGGGGGGGRPF